MTQKCDAVSNMTADCRLDVFSSWKVSCLMQRKTSENFYCEAFDLIRHFSPKHDANYLHESFTMVMQCHCAMAFWKHELIEKMIKFFPASFNLKSPEVHQRSLFSATPSSRLSNTWSWRQTTGICALRRQKAWMMWNSHVLEFESNLHLPTLKLILFTNLVLTSFEKLLIQKSIFGDSVPFLIYSYLIKRCLVITSVLRKVYRRRMNQLFESSFRFPQRDGDQLRRKASLIPGGFMAWSEVIKSRHDRCWQTAKSCFNIPAQPFTFMSMTNVPVNFWSSVVSRPLGILNAQKFTSRHINVTFPLQPPLMWPFIFANSTLKVHQTLTQQVRSATTQFQI